MFDNSFVAIEKNNLRAKSYKGYSTDVIKNNVDHKMTWKKGKGGKENEKWRKEKGEECFLFIMYDTFMPIVVYPWKKALLQTLFTFFSGGGEMIPY